MPFFRWWIRQLAELVSPRLLDFYLDAGEAAVLEITGDTFALHVRRKGVSVRAGGGVWQDIGHVLESLPDLPQLRLLRIPVEQVLRKRVSLPVAARRDLKNVLGFEIDRETPFEQAEVYWGYSLADAAKGKLDIDLVVIRRRVGDALVEAARTAGFPAAALEVVHDNRRPTLIWLETPNLLRFYRPRPKVRPFKTVAYGFCAALVIAPFAIQQARSFLADRTVAALEPQARAASALNQAANRRMAALAFMGQPNRAKGSALEILLAATRAMPDDSFLTSFDVQGGQVTMAGSSEAAAKLINALARSAAFREPVFDSAVLQSDGDDLEKFTISAKLAAAGAP
jgi:general secretion pathway protein L